MPDLEGFPAYPYNETPPAPFGATLTTSWDMGHDHTVEIPNTAFGAVGPNFRRNVHMVTELLGVAVAAPMLWWASGQTNNPRARAALRALAIGMGVTDAALLSSYAYDIRAGR